MSVSPLILPTQPTIAPTRDSAGSLNPADLSSARVLHQSIKGQPVDTAAVSKLPCQPIDWRGLFETISQTVDVGGREAAYRSYVVNLSPPDRSVIETALAMATELPEPEPESKPIPEFIRRIKGAVEFNRLTFTREWLIDGVLVKGQPALVAAPKKSGKTITMTSAAIEMAAGAPFLGQFKVARPYKVLYLSGESGEETVQDVARRVCDFHGIDLEALEGNLFIGPDLPRLADEAEMEALAEYIADKGIECVVIDPIYLCLFGGSQRIDPANLFDVGPLLRKITKLCLDAGATPILVHHFRKYASGTDPDTPPELEDIAFSGFAEFARQWILLKRRKPYDHETGVHDLWFSFGGSRGHGGLYELILNEGVMGDDFGGRTWEITLNRASEVFAKSKDESLHDVAARQLAKQKAKDQADEERVAEDMVKLVDALKASSAPLTKTELRATMKWNSGRFNQACAGCAIEGRIKATTKSVSAGTKGGTRIVDAFTYSTDPTKEHPDNTRTTPGQHPDVPVCPTPGQHPDRSGRGNPL